MRRWILLLPFLAGCGEASPPFERAAEFVRVQSSATWLSVQDPVFRNLEGGHRPSDWVSYFFSVLSTRNWVSEDAEQPLPGTPLKPKGISIVPLQPRKDSRGPQLVVIPDDEAMSIIVEGYGHPPAKPLFRAEWAFPTID